MSNNYYQLLHVLPDAPAPVIKASYRAMMQKLRHHPDLGGDPSRAQLLNEAVDTLCNPHKRAIYDSELFTLESRMNQAPEPDQSPADAGASAQQAQNGTSRTGGYSAAAGGRPHGYEARPEPADEHEDPDAEPLVEPAVSQILLPTRPHCLFCKASFSTSPRARQHYRSDNQCHQCHAPAAALEQMSTSTTEELRRIYRHDHHASVRLWTHWPLEAHLEARLQDVSLAGCAIESYKPLASHAMVLIDTDALKAICQVRHCNRANGGATFSIGLAFKTLKIQARPGTMFTAVA